MADYVETLRLEYLAEEAARQAKAMGIALEEVNTYAIAQAGVIQNAGQAIELYGDTYELMPPKIETATAAMKTHVAAVSAAGTATAKATAETGNAGRGILQFAYILDDSKQFQYGFADGMRAIGNNIPMLLTGLGLSGGVAGAVAILGSVAAVAGPKLADLFSSFFTSDVDQAKTAVGQLTDQIKKLEDAKVTLTVDTFQLDVARQKLAALKKDQDAFDAATRGTQLQQESAQQLGQLLTEAPGGEQALRDRLKAQQVRGAEAVNAGIAEANAKLPKLDADIADLQRANAAATDLDTQLTTAKDLARAQAERSKLGEQITAIQSAIRANAEVAVGNLLREAQTGGAGTEAAQFRLAQQIARLGGKDVQFAAQITGKDFGPEFGRIGGLTPTALAQTEEEDRATAKEEEANENAKTARKRRETAAKKAADERKSDAARELELAQLGERLLNEGIRPGETEDAGRKRITAEKEANRETDAQRRKNLAAAKARDEPIVEGLTGGVGLPVEGLLAQNALARAQNDAIRARGGRGVRGGVASDEQAAEILTERLSALLQRTGQDTDPLHARAVAGEVVQKAQEDLQKKTGLALGQTQNLQAAMLQTMQLLANDLSTMDQRTALLWQQLAGVRQQRQQVVRTSQNRAR